MTMTTKIETTYILTSAAEIFPLGGYFGTVRQNFARSQGVGYRLYGLFIYCNSQQPANNTLPISLSQLIEVLFVKLFFARAV